jgi:hypothetical protein
MSTSMVYLHDFESQFKKLAQWMMMSTSMVYLHDFESQFKKLAQWMMMSTSMVYLHENLDNVCDYTISIQLTIQID